MVITPYIQNFYDDTLANGGATVDLDKHHLPQPEGRFFVGAGTRTWEHKVPVDEFTPQYLASLVFVAIREGFHALGTWLDEGSNCVVIEPTDIYHDRLLALMSADDADQEAIYDSVEDRTIYL